MAEVETRPYWEYIVNPISRNLPLPSEPRYERATQLALIYILTERIDSFPVDPYAFFRKYHIRLQKYSTIARKTNFENIAEVTRQIGSNDGITACRNGIVSVIYNDVTPYTRRILFTLLHEIGHIVLGHVFDFEKVRFNRGGTDDVEVLEREADCFARNLIAPAFMVNEMHHLNKASGMDMFGCTGTCWDVRISRLNTDLANTNPALIPLLREQLSSFMYGITCMRCNAGFIGHRGIQYCPICGSRRLKWRNQGMVYTDLYPIDDEGRVKKCPRCDNEILDDGEFCMICGAPVVNRCVNQDCQALAFKGNARFCTKCGCETTFMDAGLLKTWESEKNAPVFTVTDDALPF